MRTVFPVLMISSPCGIGYGKLEGLNLDYEHALYYPFNSWFIQEERDLYAASLSLTL